MVVSLPSVTGTIRRLDAPSPAWFMEVRGDYYFDEFLDGGGASSDMDVSVFLSKKISKGFYTAPVGERREGCSVLSAYGAEGGHLWGRNYDWTASVPIIVRHVPEEGYASLSTCDRLNSSQAPNSSSSASAARTARLHKRIFFHRDLPR
mgnify:CR=1 FL=1